MSMEDTPKIEKVYNPYLAGRREWNERYGNYIKAKRVWQIVAICSLAAVIVCVIWLGVIGSQNKLIPYIVEVDKLGKSLVVGPAEQTNYTDQRIIISQLSNFIFNLRVVSSDAALQKKLLFDAYKMINQADLATKLIADYYGGGQGPNSPFIRAQTELVEVEISTVLPQTNETWEVEWEEIIRTRKGELVDKKRMRALLQIYFAKPDSTKGVYSNPAGIFVKQFNWSEQL